MYIYIYIYTHTNIHTHIHVHNYTHTHTLWAQVEEARREVVKDNEDLPQPAASCPNSELHK